MFDAFIWLLAVESLGALVFPLSFSLFHRLPDRGYTLTKPLALVLFSYTLWALGLTHLIPNSPLTIFSILLVGTVISALVLWRQRSEIWAFLHREWLTLIVAEVVFLGVFLLWLAIVSEVPAINHTEKPMDFAFMNASLQSRYFPPEDPWLAGHPISYYYFGHLMMAFLTNLTAIPSSISYNLAVVLLPALVGAGSFGLLYNLVRLSGSSRARAIGFGLVAPVLVMFIGNLEGVLELVHTQGWGSEGFWEWVGIKGLEAGAATGSGPFPEQPWWWWRATRVIDTLVDGRSLDYTITEFPFFSFMLGDLHAHVMSLPFLLLNLSLGLNLFVSPEKLGLSWLRRHWVEAGAISLFLGSLAFINAWDFPVLGVVLGTIVLARNYGDEAGNLGKAIKATALLMTPMVLGSIVLFLPFYLTLSSQASGILPLREVSTRPFLFFLVMGLFLVLGVSFLLRQLAGLVRPTYKDAPAIQLLLVVTLAPFLLWAAIELVLSLFDAGIISAGRRIGERFLWILPGLAIVGLAGFSAAQRAQERHPHSFDRSDFVPRQVGVDLRSELRTGSNPSPSRGRGVGGGGGLPRPDIPVFPLVLLAVAFYLLVGVELFYVVDLFGNRMNTVFKLYFQSWLLLAIVGSFGIYYWFSAISPGESGQSAVRGCGTRTLRCAQGDNEEGPQGYNKGGLQGDNEKVRSDNARGDYEKKAKGYRLPGRLLRIGRYAWAGGVPVLLVASLYYPVGAVLDRTGILQPGHSLGDNTLDGLAFVKITDPGEYAAINWLRDQAPWGRIVEAVGDDYSEYGRISASTGRPTVLGWKGHEHQWRGTTRVFNGREADVAQIYRSDDVMEARRLLDRYDVRYVYSGRRERTSYGSEHLSKFSGFLRTAFDQGGVIIYERSAVSN